MTEAPLTVAVTGPTGEIGLSLLAELQRDPAVAAVRGMARRPFDPAREGWDKVAYRRGDVLGYEIRLVREGSDAGHFEASVEVRGHPVAQGLLSLSRVEGIFR